MIFAVVIGVLVLAYLSRNSSPSGPTASLVTSTGSQSAKFASSPQFIDVGDTSLLPGNIDSGQYLSWLSKQGLPDTKANLLAYKKSVGAVVHDSSHGLSFNETTAGKDLNKGLASIPVVGGLASEAATSTVDIFGL